MRLAHLPWYPSSVEALEEIIAELQEAILDLMEELRM
jgi:hypothetical protein